MGYKGSGGVWKDKNLSINDVPPSGCYFEVTFFPGFNNGVKIAKMIFQFKNGHNWEIVKGLIGALSLIANAGLSANKIEPANRLEGESQNRLDQFYYFLLGLSGMNPLDFRFNKVSGLSTEIETEEIRIGGLNTEMLQLPNRVKHGNLMLERGFFLGSPLTVEFNAAMTLFQMIPCEILVTLQKPNKLPLAAWLFRNAYPVSWSNSDLCSDDNGIFMEKMEFAYSHFYPIRV